MTRTSITKTVACLAIVCASGQVVAKSIPLKLVGLTEKDAPGGCSCTVRNEKNEIVLYSDLDAKAPTTINLSGTVAKLKFISTTNKDGMEKIGNKFERFYGNEKTRLNLKYTTVRVCDGKDESCEVTKYSVNLLLEDNIDKKGEDYPNRLELKGLAGDCGC
jgi:hypothetical protein